MDYAKTTIEEGIRAGGQFKTPQRVKQDEAYKKKLKQMENYNQEHFTAFHDKECLLVFNTLTLELAGVLLNMFAYMEQGESGQLKLEGKRMGVKELSKILRKSERTVKGYLNELEALGYIEADKDGKRKVYSVDTRLANRGRRVVKGYFTKLYIVRLRDALKVMTIQEAGLLFFMIPHMNTRAFVLCSNPYETDIEKIELWTREQLAEGAGLSLVQVKRLVSSLMKKQVLLSVTTHRTAIVLSPELISRQTTKISTYEIAQILRNEVNGSEVSW
ncbi:helix-turn-helix domain-containing protein [Bacillus licheniformis]|uniref:helix-turn-helix domain-containing protein n=1 Tax=Bacillus licheniformis TaxID=1402 RepID=UPI00018C8055|nr:helix-turn-helix domain-containing protein [Bacillus licheniformis]MDH3162340.1 helix-turn-helix domain-containing protein [Bacillus licheniformis]MED4409026.1 helix-turn-helix domain-containing protein [Bacillus licheniformis]QDL76920.1 transcriptional regulator [Bacillus licheniformis]